MQGTRWDVTDRHRTQQRLARTARRALSYIALQLLLGGCADELNTNTKRATHGNECATCHLDEWMQTRAPSHSAPETSFGEDCASCHDEERWSPARGFVHTATFPLTLGHADRVCASCHVQGFARGATKNDCASCHAPRAANVRDPIHAGLSQSCFACHKTDKFSPSTFIHSWPLKGVHTRTACNACHTGMPARYEGTEPECITCHARDRALADGTVSGHSAYSSTCETCHGFDTFSL